MKKARRKKLEVRIETQVSNKTQITKNKIQTNPKVQRLN